MTASPGWLHRLRHSLHLRLVALFLLLALAMSAAFVLGMQRAFSGGWRELVRPLLTDYVDRLAADIGSPPDPARARALARRLPIRVLVRGPNVNFDTHDDPATRDGAEATPQTQTQTQSEPGGRGLSLWRLREPTGTGPWLLTRVSADGHTVQFGLELADVERRPRLIGWFTLAVILLLTLGAYAYVRRLLAPLGQIGAGARRFGAGDFSVPIALHRHDELGDLAAQVDTMARDLHAMLEAKRTLLLAISHELRSPLTRARLNAELVDDSPARDALLRDLAAMRDLITDLLDSERLAAGHAALQREATDLAELVAQAVLEQCPPGAADLSGVQKLELLALDPARLRLVLRNLIGNALRHGQADGQPARLQLTLERGVADLPPVMTPGRHHPPEADPPATAAGGPTRAAVVTADAGVWLSVRDFGPGVPPDQLVQLGAAFWRADPARQRSTGGVGLGLTLVRLVVQAHGGRLVFTAAAPGLRVSLWLPRRPAPAGRQPAPRPGPA